MARAACSASVSRFVGGLVRGVFRHDRATDAASTLDYWSRMRPASPPTQKLPPPPTTRCYNETTCPYLLLRHSTRYPGPAASRTQLIQPTSPSRRFRRRALGRALVLRLWRLVFDRGFAPPAGRVLDLSDLLDGTILHHELAGCDTRCLEACRYVPPAPSLSSTAQPSTIAPQSPVFRRQRGGGGGFDVLGVFPFYHATVADDSQP